MKKITVDCRMIYHSGIGTYLRNLLRELISMQKWQFELLGNTQKIIQAFVGCDPGVFQIKEANSPIYSLKEQWEIPRIISKNSDLLWVPHYNIPILYSKKLMVTIHDVFHLSEPSFLKRFYARTLLHQAIFKSNQILCNSAFTRNEIEIRLKKNIRHKSEVTHLGIDENWPSYPVNSPPHPKKFLLYVGNVKPNKNLKNLLKAYLKICDQIEEDLLIVGKKEGFLTSSEEIYDLAKKREERIIFTGEIPYQDSLLANYYSHASAFVFPSLYEGFGLPPLEAIARNCPVLGSDIPVLKEIYQDAILYCNPLDPNSIAENILVILKDPKTKENLNSACSQVLKRLSWKSCAEKTSAQIDKILDSK